MQGLQIGIPQRLTLLRVITVLAMLLSLAVTAKLWSFARLFPFAPAVDGGYATTVLPPYLLIAAMICFAASLVFKWHRLLLSIALLCILTLVLFDTNRLQQWVFIYWSVLVVLVFYNGRVDDPNKYTSYFIIIQVMVCGVYFYTGIHQLQPSFLAEELSPAISPLRSVRSDRQFGFVLKLGVCIPFIFIFVAFALIIAPLRYLGITLAVFIHLSLLLLLWPIKKGDAAGYIFNIVMIPMVVLLFSGRTKQRYFSPGFILQRPVFYPVVAVFLVMPAFNNSGRWPDAMSANVYSGNRDRFEILVPVATYLRLPLQVKTFCRPQEGMLILSHREWSRFETGVICSDEPHVREAIVSRLEFWDRGPVKDMELRIRERQKILVMP